MKFKLAQNQALYNEIANAKLYRLPDGRYYSNSPAMNALIYIESKGNANAKNPTSSATGLLQQITSNGKQYGLIGKGFDNRRDPFASFEAGKKFAIDNLLNYDRNGIASNAKLQYLAHQQGPGGALKILRGQVDPQTRRNMMANAGGQAGGDFAGFWGKKVDQAMQALAKDGVASRVEQGTMVEGLTTPQGQAAPQNAYAQQQQQAAPPPAPVPQGQPLQELGVSYTNNDTISPMDTGMGIGAIPLPQELYPILPVAARKPYDV